MAAGKSNTFRRAVDFNSHEMRLARLGVDAVFITSPSIDNVYTCARPGAPQKSTKDGASFQQEISKVITDQNGVQYKCREIRFKPRNVIHEIIGDHPSFEVSAIFKDPTNPSAEYPELLPWLGANGNYNLTSRQWQQVSDANPWVRYNDIPVEYSPSEQSAPAGGGTPSTTQPPSTTKPR
jgi:hypothetical protein